jgi:hypothetical protein
MTNRARQTDDDAFLRTFVFPEEDRPLLTTTRWRGEYRWFRSPNVIPLERHRSPAEWSRVCAALLKR